MTVWTGQTSQTWSIQWHSALWVCWQCSDDVSNTVRWFARWQELCNFVFDFKMLSVQLISNAVDLCAAWCGISSNYFGHLFCIIRSTPPSWPNKVGLKCPYVRPSTKSFFDFNEIWYVGRGWWVMHDGMQYDPIQGRGQGHEPFKVGNWAIFKGYLTFIMGAGKWPWILKLGHSIKSVSGPDFWFLS